jgi:hypothetical protein
VLSDGRSGAAGAAVEKHGVDADEGVLLGRAYATPTTTNASGGDDDLLMDTMEARVLLIVEKDAVFYRLMASRVFDKMPVILLSGFGFPSAAARSMASAICDAAALRNHGQGPPLQVFGIVDYNPSGVQILLKYMQAASAATTPSLVVGRSGDRDRCTAAAMDIRQSAFHRRGAPDTVMPPHSASLGDGGGQRCDGGGLANLRWLGMRSRHIAATMDAVVATRTTAAVAPLTDRDRRMLASLLKKCSVDDRRAVSASVAASSSLSSLPPQRWWEELHTMHRLGVRCDIEAWYSNDKRTHHQPSTWPHVPMRRPSKGEEEVEWVDVIVRAVLTHDAI